MDRRPAERKTLDTSNNTAIQNINAAEPTYEGIKASSTDEPLG